MAKPVLSPEVIKKYMPAIFDLPEGDRGIMALYALGYPAKEIAQYTRTATKDVQIVIVRHDPNGIMVLKNKIKYAIAVSQCDSTISQLLPIVQAGICDITDTKAALDIAHSILDLKKKLEAYVPKGTIEKEHKSIKERLS